MADAPERFESPTNWRKYKEEAARQLWRTRLRSLWELLMELLGREQVLPGVDPKTAKILKKFERQYFFRAPWSEYISMVGIAKTGENHTPCPDNERGNDCILVGLSKPLSRELALPSIFEGYRVFVLHTGAFEAFESEGTI